MVGVLLFCFTPFAVLIVFDVRQVEAGLPPATQDFVSDLLGMNSVLNPAIYSMRHKEYRTALKKWFSCP